MRNKSKGKNKPKCAKNQMHITNESLKRILELAQGKPSAPAQREIAQLAKSTLRSRKEAEEALEELENRHPRFAQLLNNGFKLE